MNVTDIAKFSLDEALYRENIYCDCLDETIVEDAIVDFTAHDAQYHNGHFDDKTMKCKLRERLAGKDKTDKALSQASGSSAAAGQTSQHGGSGTSSAPAQVTSPKAISFLQKLLARDPNGPKAADYKAAIAKLQASVVQPVATNTAQQNPTASVSAMPSDEDFDTAIAYLVANPDANASAKLADLPNKIFQAAENIENIELTKEGVKDADALKALDDMINDEAKTCDVGIKELRDLVDDLVKKNAANPPAPANATPSPAPAPQAQQTPQPATTVSQQPPVSVAPAAPAPQPTTPAAPSTTQPTSTSTSNPNFMGGNTMVTDGADGKTINAARKAAGLPELKALENIDAIVQNCEAGMRSKSGTFATKLGDPAIRLTAQRDFDTANKNFATTVKNIVSNGRICTVMKPHRLLEFLQSGVFKNKYDTNYERQEQMSAGYGIPTGSTDGAAETPFSGTCLSKDVNRMFESQAFNVYGLVAVEWKKDGGLVPCFSASDAGEPLRDENYHAQAGKSRMFNPSLVSNPSIVSLPAFTLGYRSKVMIDPSQVQNPIGTQSPNGQRESPQAAAVKLFKQGPIQGDALDFDNAVNEMNHGPVKYNNGSERYFGWNELQILGKGSTDEVKALHINSKKWASAIAAQANMSSNNGSTSPINGQWATAQAFVNDLVQQYGQKLQQMGIQIVLDGQDVMSPGTPVLDEAIGAEMKAGLLEKHDAKYHHGHFDGSQRCKFRQDLAKHDDADAIPDPEQVAAEESEEYGNARDWQPSDQSPCESSYDAIETFGHGNPHTEVLDDIPDDKRMDMLLEIARTNLPQLEISTQNTADELGYYFLLRPVNKKTGEKMKDPERIMEKAHAHFNDDLGYLNDVIGTTIIVPDDGDFNEVVESFKKNLPKGATIERIKKLDHRNSDGYYDLKITTKFANGGLGETIVMNHNQFDVKMGENNGGGHIVYDLSRVFKPVSPKIEQQLVDLSKMIYARGSEAPSDAEFAKAKAKCYVDMQDMIEEDVIKDERMLRLMQHAMDQWGKLRPNDRTPYRFERKS